MKKVSLYLAVNAAIIFSGCSNQNNISKEQKALMENEVKALLDHYRELYNKRTWNGS